LRERLRSKRRRILGGHAKFSDTNHPQGPKPEGACSSKSDVSKIPRTKIEITFVCSDDRKQCKSHCAWKSAKFIKIPQFICGVKPVKHSTVFLTAIAKEYRKEV
jgi:hypothetical protein